MILRRIVVQRTDAASFIDFEGIVSPPITTVARLSNSSTAVASGWSTPPLPSPAHPANNTAIQIGDRPHTCTMETPLLFVNIPDPQSRICAADIRNIPVPTDREYLTVTTIGLFQQTTRTG